MNDSFVLGYAAGVLFAVTILLSVAHIEESKCQAENNIADCTWVLVTAKVQP
jgi:hypothetical protein